MKMDYVRAADVLPEWLLGMVQEYAAGTCLYIPQRCGDRRRWGGSTDSGSWYRDRNRRIYLCRMEGIPVREISRRFFLSEKSVYRIILQEKRQN